LFDEIVAFAELGPFIDTPVKRYSSGMYVRLGFSVAAHVEPDILLVDEVLSVGDLAFQYKCQKRMRALRERGATLLFVSHSLNAVQGVCDQAIFLLSGSVQDQGQAADVVQRYAGWINQSQLEAMGRPAAERTVGRAGPVEIGSAQLLTMDGRGSDRFSFGEGMRVRVSLRVREPIPQPLFTIMMVRSDGLHCCAIKSTDVLMEAMEGECTVEAVLKEVRLNGGAYSIEFLVADRTDRAFFWQPIARFLIVDSPSLNTNLQWGGVYIPETSWRMDV
jgi:lipopolysaccharide transport system ATP-binding protein